MSHVTGASYIWSWFISIAAIVTPCDPTCEGSLPSLAAAVCRPCFSLSRGVVEREGVAGCDNPHCTLRSLSTYVCMYGQATGPAQYFDDMHGILDILQSEVEASCLPVSVLPLRVFHTSHVSYW